MPLFEFQCPKGHITEELTKADVKTVSCAKCKPNFGVPSLATRVLSATRTTFEFADTRKRHRAFKASVGQL